MFNKTIPSLIILSLLHTNAAFCMENPDEERLSRSPSKNSKIEVGQSAKRFFLKWGDETLPKENRLEALKTFLKELSCGSDLDEDTREKIGRMILSFLNDEALSLKDRIQLLWYKQNPPVDILLKLSKALEPEHTSENLVLKDQLGLINQIRNCSDSRIQQKIENFFFEHPNDFMHDCLSRIWLEKRFKKSEEPLQNLILQKYCEVTQFSPDSNSVDLRAAQFVYEESSNKNFKEIVSNNLFQFIENASNELYETKKQACCLLLEHSQDSDINNRTSQWLFNEIKKESSSDNFNEQCSYVIFFLRQENPKQREEVFYYCNKIIDTSIPEDLKHQENLALLCNTLRQIEGTSELSNKILDRLRPILMNIASSSDSSASDFDAHGNFFAMFLLSPEEKDRQLVYDHVKRTIIHNNASDNAHGAAMLIVNYFEESHPWVQEVIQLMVAPVDLKKSDDSDVSDCPFAIHRELLKRIKEPAIPNPSTTILEDGRTVRFSLSVLQSPRKIIDLPPVELSELTRLSLKLMEEIGKNSSNLSPLMGEWDPNLLLKAAENPFLKRLLSNTSFINVGISIKLRQLLLMAKKAEEQSSSNAFALESDTGLSSTSNIILQLLENVTTCDTGVADGIDVAYRLITGGSSVSEETMQNERIQEKAKRVLTDELIKTREGLLNGEGLVASHFLDPEDKLDENVVTHSAHYLKNLLGHQIGTFFEGEQISFDLNGCCVAEELIEAPLQNVLDVFHSHYTPDKVISNFLQKFNEKKLPEAFISSLITPKELFNNKYVSFLNEDPSDDFISWKPLVVAELLLRLGILEEAPKLPTSKNE